ncbi:class I SAM-dependent DNA methyltransferase [Sorangium sp. So ce131]|uniref:class I SAM-dependent DNA methyltransferase n=1 Tax=Sorangium sp. So ce131 TaxID=3133282 RepID=UPI003F643DF0
MSSQYDSFAHTYRRLGAIDVRRYVDQFSFMKVLGDIEGKSILDVGCGTGVITRVLKQRGARRVVGLDISEGMLEAARCEEGKSPLGVEYVQRDLIDAGAVGPFDIVTACFVLPHAASPEQLFAMCKGVSEALSPGGRFVALQPNDGFAVNDPEFYRAYGLRASVEGRLEDAAPMTVNVSSGDIEITILTQYWTRAGYEAALRRAGLVDIQWRSPEVSPEGIAAHGEQFWSNYRARPYAMLLECTKAPAPR